MMTTVGREADSIVQNQTMQSPLDISHSLSVNTIPSVRDYIISEDLLAGQRIRGRMSSVRRFFCLFVTFDLLFTSLMWIICIMLNGEYLIQALKEQVVHYNIHTSLFDIVLVAVCRFTLLIFFYALLYINHWIIITISTTCTCGFLITKVFYFDWPHSSQPVFEVLLVLTSFILSWGEAWFLDFKVLPQEAHASNYIITTDSERAPLIRSYIQGIPSMYTESVAEFHSPQGTPEGSMHRFQQSPSSRYPPVRLTRDMEENYKKLAAKVLQESWDLYCRKDWKLQKQSSGDAVYDRVDTKGKKMFKLHTTLERAPRFLLYELFYRVEDTPKWNSTLKESNKVQSIDENTDVVYSISKNAAGGLVSSRDFVDLRHWAFIENRYVIAHVKTDHPSLPSDKKLIRGENGVGCTILEPTGEPDRCNLVWIVNVDLKIRVPNSILDREMLKMMLTFAKDLREHLRDKNAPM